MYHKVKKIKQRPTESVWEFNQRFKVLFDYVSFDIALQKHKEWFIATLLPHIKFPLMQQKIKIQAKALELAMKLEVSPIGYANEGMQQI